MCYSTQACWNIVKSKVTEKRSYSSVLHAREMIN